jgi:cold shock CspA family protein
MSERIDREHVLAALRSRGARSMHFMEVLEQLDLDKGRRDDVLDVLLELTGLGLAKELPGRRFKLAVGPRTAKRRAARAAPREEAAPDGGEDVDEARGWLTLTKRGFAFVAAEDGGPDVFIPPTGLGHALHGDRVRVQTRPSSRGQGGKGASSRCSAAV